MPRGGLGTLSSKVNLPHTINFTALYGANLVTYPANFRGVETLELHRVVTDKRLNVLFAGQIGNSRVMRPSLNSLSDHSLRCVVMSIVQTTDSIAWGQEKNAFVSFHRTHAYWSGEGSLHESVSRHVRC